MNELQTLRRMRESTPPPSDESLAALRGRLVGATQARRGIRIPRLAWRLTVVGAVSTGLLVGAAVLQNGTEPSAPVPFLERAAAAVEERAGTDDPPRPDQWIYQQQHDQGVPDLEGNIRNGSHETWESVGSGDWWSQWGDDAPVEQKDPVFRPRGHDWDRWKTLPRDPELLLAQVDAELEQEPRIRTIDGVVTPLTGKERDLYAFHYIGGFLGDGPGLSPPPDLQAAIYRALELIPDVKVTEHLTDFLGRDVVLVSHPNVGPGRETPSPTNGRFRKSLMVDPTTYDFLGWATKVKDGKVVEGTAELGGRIVDKPLER